MSRRAKTSTSAASEGSDQVSKILERLDQVEMENAELKKRVMELEKKLEKADKKVSEKMSEVKTTLEKEFTSDSYVSKLKKGLNTGPGKVVTISEVADMQDRRMNVIIRGVKENDSDEAEERRRHDLEGILDVVCKAGLDPDTFKDAMVGAYRLGRREAGEKEKRSERERNLYRPLLVKLSSREVREKAMRCNRLLRQYNKESKDRGVETRFRIDADLTREQKENLDRMWEMAREKSAEEAKNGIRYFVIGQENPMLKSSKIAQE